ncbi:hypothetical protein [Nesterenkonia sp. Act20]|uniref:variant leucine-rich repeat-containing protein n=1 Tax=Nesterenkonia sp. Act20 TaxID=1483432 RepID=UPI001C44F9D1|nr:hypothetical protein [Nesterenkonia sp. Act20]
MASIYDELGAIAADPHTDWDTLHWIAENYPELRPAVAENPAAYPELLDALSAIGDPEIDAALARRRSQPRASVNPPTAASSAERTGLAGESGSGGPARSARGGSSSWWIATPDEETPSPPIETASDTQEEWFGSRPSDTAASTAAAPGPAGRPSTTPPRRSRPSTRRLMLALVLPLIALVAVGAMVLALLDVNQGDSTATEATAPASPSAQEDAAEGSPGEEDADPDEGAASSTTEPATLQELRAAVTSLPEESTCASVADDAATFAEFGTAVTTDGGGLEPSDSILVQETLLGLQESCGSVHAAALYLDLRGSEEATALAGTVQEMGSAWIQTSFPAQGQPLESFAAPGGNVVCELGEAMRCTVLEHSFSAPEGCTGGVTYAIEVDRPAEPACGDPVEPAGQPVLGYGQTASNEFYACSSFQSQMSCWNQLTGEGINLSASRNATY